MLCIKLVSTYLLLSIWTITLISTRKSDSNPFSWKIDRVKCTSSFCSAHHCKVDRKSSHQQVLNVFCTLDEPVNAIVVHARLFYRYQTVYRKFMYDMNIDLCDYLGERKQFQPLLEVFGTYIEQYSNVNHSCPFVGNITVVELPYESAMLKDTILPRGQYRTDVQLRDTQLNRTVFEASTYLTRL